MALQTASLNADGVCEVQIGAGSGLAGAGELGFVRPVAEVLDEVGLPIGGAVAEICWVKRGFLVGVVGIVLLNVMKDGRRGEEGNGLRQKDVFLVAGFGQIGRDRLFGVDAGGGGTGGEQAGLAKDRTLGLFLEEAASLEPGGGKAEREDGDQQDVELDKKLQVLLLEWSTELGESLGRKFEFTPFAGCSSFEIFVEEFGETSTG